MNGRIKRALSASSQEADADTQTKLKKVKGNDMHMQWDMEVDSNDAGQEHRYDGSPWSTFKYEHFTQLVLHNHHPV